MRRALAVLVFSLPLLAVACGAGETAAPTTVTVADSAAVDATDFSGLAERCKHGNPDDTIEYRGATQKLSVYCEFRRKANVAAAQANVRNATVALEAFYTEHQTYEGATSEALMSAYDPQLRVTLGAVSATLYCVQSIVGEASYRKTGPGAEIESGRCDGAPVEDFEDLFAAVQEEETSRRNDTEAKANLRAAVPSLEAYYADNGTYVGMTLAGIQATYDSRVRNITFGVLTPKSYCIQSVVGGATFNRSGPSADIVSGPC